MSNSNHPQESHVQATDNHQDHGYNHDQNHINSGESVIHEQEESFHEDEDEDDGELSDQEYYDPQEDLAYFHDQKLRIEESWLEWERQTTVNNRQNNGSSSHNFHVFQKPGSTKRRERRQRSAMAQLNSRPSSVASGSGSAASAGSGAGSNSGMVPGSGPGLASEAAAEKLRRLGSYRPALASSIVHSYSNLSWEATQAARERRLAAKAAPSGTGENIMCTLPVEILSHIVSHLEPNELFNASLVCQLLYHVVNADSCWKQAFIKFFGASIPFKRLDPKSWRGEYIKRTRLLRRWEKGRGFNLLIDPKIGQISKLWAEADNRPNEGWFLAGGLAEGVVARCNPLLGKVQKDAVFRMVHLANSEVAVMALDRHRVLWGLTTGQVCLTTLSYAAAGQTFQIFAGFHHGPVSCVKLIPNHLGFVLTGGVDGVIKLWDVSKARCVREFSTGSNLNGPNIKRIDHICCEPGSRIVAGTSKGEIFAWEVDINAIVIPRSPAASNSASGVSSPAQSASTDNLVANLTIPAVETVGQDQGTAAGETGTLYSALPMVAKLPEEFQGVDYLEVDFGMHHHAGLILARAVDSKVLHVFSLDTLTHLATLKSPAHFTPVSAVHWDLPKYEKPMIALPSTQPHNLHHPNKVPAHGRQDTPSLLATGDLSGNICLWYLSDILKRQPVPDEDLHPSQVQREPLLLEPSCVLKGHDTRVTSLFVDKLIIVSGSEDGWVKAWNPVNGRPITVLNTGYMRGREVNAMNSSAVKCLVVNSLQCRGIMSIGGLIRSWDFSPEANLVKDNRNRKHVAKKPVHFSAGHKNKIQNDIRHSLEETVSLNRLKSHAKDRQELLHRRFNNLEGLNMIDMTDEEVVEYVMMLSKDQEEQMDQESAVQIAMDVQQVQEIEDQLAWERQILLETSNGGEGSSSSSFSRAAHSSVGWAALQDENVTEQELEEEEELVRRAIAMSMLDAESGSDDTQQQHLCEGHTALDPHDVQDTRDHIYQPAQWETSHVVNVDSMGLDDELARQEDQRIVESILQELEAEAKEDRSKSAADLWPTVGEATATSLSSTLELPLVDGSADTEEKRDEAPPVKKMTWSMVARTNSEASFSDASSAQTTTQHSQSQEASRSPAIIKQYPRSASQEEIEDEDTLLARILSLSMVEK